MGGVKTPKNHPQTMAHRNPLYLIAKFEQHEPVTDYSYNQIVHLTSNALIVAVQDSCRGSFRLVRANLKCDPIDAEF
jgi:hypothetical protein